MYASPDSHQISDEIIDLRSDTVSHPTPAMRRAMAEAEVGDDVFGDDPTVNKLESLAAQMLGKESAVFVPSGSMANAVASVAQLRRGDEVIVGARTHMYLNEQAALAVLSQAQAVPIMENPDGTLPLDLVEDSIRTPDPHHPVTRMICIENTHNACGGQPLTVEYTNQAGALAKKHGLRFHIDGARLFNAAVALNVNAADLVRAADTVSFCLSKGLCAPIGSLVCGDKETIIAARRARKLLGGGMRQAGIVAAAGIVALTSMVERLENDHDDARRLAQGLSTIKGIVIDPKTVRTNMVYFDLAPGAKYDAHQLTAALKDKKVWMLPVSARRIRAVLHYWISPAQVDRAVEVMKEVMK
jgi:threonine aldolase